MSKYMILKKWNKEKLVLRILTFPIKLIFQIIWNFLTAILYSFKWLKNGAQELVYSDDHKAGLVKLIEQNQEIIDAINKDS